TTPRCRSAGVRLSKAWRAPRSLKEPVRWRSSRFSHTRAPPARASAGASCTGVRRTPPQSRRAAATTSSRVREGVFMEKQKSPERQAQGFGREWVFEFEIYTATRRRPEKGRIIIAAIIIERWL